MFELTPFYMEWVDGRGRNLLAPSFSFPTKSSDIRAKPLWNLYFVSPLFGVHSFKISNRISLIILKKT